MNFPSVSWQSEDVFFFIEEVFQIVVDLDPDFVFDLDV